MHYLNMQIAWLRANAEASEWPSEVTFGADLPEQFHSGERIPIDIFLLDGIDIRTLNVNCLRSFLGLVGQEPVLFMGSITENIRLGAIDGKATSAEVWCHL